MQAPSVVRVTCFIAQCYPVPGQHRPNRIDHWLDSIDGRVNGVACHPALSVSGRDDSLIDPPEEFSQRCGRIAAHFLYLVFGRLLAIFRRIPVQDLFATNTHETQTWNLDVAS
jgi:hypothetical protein